MGGGRGRERSVFAHFRKSKMSGKILIRVGLSGYVASEPVGSIRFMRNQFWLNIKSQNKLDNNYIKNIYNVSLEILIFSFIRFDSDSIRNSTHTPLRTPTSLKQKTKSNKMFNLLDLFDLNQIIIPSHNYNNIKNNQK